MIPFFPKQITQKAFVTYLVSLTIVSLAFMRYSMQVGYMALGVVFVGGFLLFTQVFCREGDDVATWKFVGYLFMSAFLLRLVWVIASYYYYTAVTGIPFEVDTADALAYHKEAEWLASEPWITTWIYYFGPDAHGVSDVGYPFYLSVIYRIFGPVIIIPRILKAVYGAWTCVLLYRLAVRTFGESVGRMAGVMCALMPNLIIYCGYHLKEVEMIFLCVAFLERADLLLRSRWFQLWNILLPTLLLASLFFFRTVLGVAGAVTLATGVLLFNAPMLRKVGRCTAIVVWGCVCLFAISHGTIRHEIEGYWEQRGTNSVRKRQVQTESGILWAKYATGSVMAPLAVALPFATMVDVDNQVAQQAKHGGNYIRNFMAFFVLLGIYEAFRQNKWRDFVMIGAFVISYLGIVSMSGFSNSERFLLPALPGLIMMWAYGVSELREKTFRLLTPWCVVVVLMEVGWAIFKLGSRGLL